MDGRVMRRGIIGSCQSAATSEIVKALLVTSLTRVSSAIASTRPLPLPLKDVFTATLLNQLHKLMHIIPFRTVYDLHAVTLQRSYAVLRASHYG